MSVECQYNVGLVSVLCQYVLFYIFVLQIYTLILCRMTVYSKIFSLTIIQLVADSYGRIQRNGIIPIRPSRRIIFCYVTA